MTTSEGMRRPQEVGWRVYAALRDRGYKGPTPVFNDMWNRWFADWAGARRWTA